MYFVRYPTPLPPLENYILLSVEGSPLGDEDALRGLLLLDGTWRYAAQMERALPKGLLRRSLPSSLVTAYPRRQTDCPLPDLGLASVEALFAAYALLKRPTEGLLDAYYWKSAYLERNRDLLVTGR